MNLIRKSFVLAFIICATYSCAKTDLHERLARRSAELDAKNGDVSEKSVNENALDNPPAKAEMPCLSAETFEFKNRESVAKELLQSVLPLCPEEKPKPNNKPVDTKDVPASAPTLEDMPVKCCPPGRGLEMLL